MYLKDNITGVNFHKCEECIKNDVCAFKDAYQEMIEAITTSETELYIKQHIEELEKALRCVSMVLDLGCKFYKKQIKL